MPCTRTTQSDKGGSSFPVHRVGDRNYPDYHGYEDKDYGEHLQRIKKFEIRQDDVIQIGYPKCGNNWMHQVTSMVLEHSQEYPESNFGTNLLDFRSSEKLEELKEIPSPRLITSHLNIESMPEQIATKKPRVIYLLRNFKDASVSMYKFAKTLKIMLVYRGEWDDYIDLQLQGLFPYGSWFDHVKAAEDFMKNHPDVPFHVLCFEKLKMEPVEELRKLCHFLGKPDDLVDAIAKKISFEQMKQTEKARFNLWDTGMVEQDSAGLLRKGIVGDWKNQFSEEQSRRADQMFEERLKGYSLGDILRPYMEI